MMALGKGSSSTCIAQTRVQGAYAREGSPARARRGAHWESSSASMINFLGPWHCLITDRYLWP